MDVSMPFPRWVRLAMLAALLVVLTGCMGPGEWSASETAVAIASREAVSSPTGSPSAPATAEPTVSRTPPREAGPSATLPSATLPSTSLPSTTLPSATLPSATLGTGGTSIAELPALNTVEPPAVAPSAAPAAKIPVAPVEGALAPDFTLIDLNGQEMSLSDLRGKPVLLNFWTTW